MTETWEWGAGHNQKETEHLAGKTAVDRRMEKYKNIPVKKTNC